MRERRYSFNTLRDHVPYGGAIPKTIPALTTQSGYGADKGRRIERSGDDSTKSFYTANRTLGTTYQTPMLNKDWQANSSQMEPRVEPRAAHDNFNDNSLPNSRSWTNLLNSTAQAVTDSCMNRWSGGENEVTLRDDSWRGPAGNEAIGRAEAAPDPARGQNGTITERPRYITREIIQDSDDSHALRSEWRTSGVPMESDGVREDLQRRSRADFAPQIPNLEYDLQRIKHRAGRLSVVPDALSRAAEAISVVEPVDVNDAWLQEMTERVRTSQTTHPDFRLVGTQLQKYCQS